MSDFFNPDLKAGSELHGFRVTRQTALPHIGGVLSELVHLSTGERHAHVSHPITENAFLIAFRTLPSDDTGVAHILEHSVLEGSENFPVKYFTQLTGRSLNSFINAFTGSDTTTYPFATSDPEDWDNLLRGYLDACLRPLMRSETLLQEGWRKEFATPEDPQSPLVIRGVVYNEMKAALSSPESQFHRRFRREIFPGSVYASESGGDPAAIPDLTEDGWRLFHRTHYIPQNAWSFSMGHLPLEPTLKRMNEAFSGFEGRQAPRFEMPACMGREPRVIRASYGASRGAAASSPRMAAVGWRLCPVTDVRQTMRLRFLLEVLAGGYSSPLNEALLSSGLGTSLAPAGFSSSEARLSFGCGLKGIEANAGEKVEALVLQTLEQIAHDGLPRDTLDAALDMFELEAREQSRVWGMPWTIGSCFFAMSPWMHGADLVSVMRVDKLLEDLRADAGREGFVSELVRDYLLDNPERILLVMEAEDGAFEAREEALAARLATEKARLDSSEEQELVEQSRRVAQWRDDQGDLSCLPVLLPQDRPRKAQGCSLEARSDGLFLRPAATNGLEYLELSFAVDPEGHHAQSMDLLSWVSQLGHAGRTVQASEERIRRLLGSFSIGSQHSLTATGDERIHEISLRAFGLGLHRQNWLDLLGDLLSRTDFKNEKRLSELLKMRQTNLRSQIISGAGAVVSQFAQDMVSPLGKLTDRIEGIGWMRHLAALDDPLALGNSMEMLLTELLAAYRAEAVLCAEEASIHGLAGDLEARLAGWQTGRLSRPQLAVDHSALSVDERLFVRSTSVDGVFHTQAWPAPAYDHEDAPALYLLGCWMEQPLYERIRAQGGAYGARAGYDWTNRAFVFQSWRDPRIGGTLDDFDAVRRQGLEGRIAQDELDRAKIESLRMMDRPLLPHEDARVCFTGMRRGRTQELKDLFRARLLDATREDLVRAAGRWLADGLARRSAIICSESMLESQGVAGRDLQHEPVLPEAVA
jgi:Zn-dependent M16 (insulinase) family peptidase